MKHKDRISHTENPAAAQALKMSLLEDHPQADITISPNIGLCACYSERGGVMVGFETASET